MPIEKKAYKQFIDSLQLLEEVIPECSWKKHKSAFDPAKTRLQLDLDTVPVEIEKDRFVAGNRLFLNGLNERQEEVFTVQITALLSIKFDASFGEDFVTFYANNTIQFTTVPLFRQIVRDALVKMSLPALTLPFLKTGHVKEISEETAVD